MTVRSAERRQGLRQAAAYPITLRDRRGKVLAQGRTANISESGAFLLARFSRIAQEQTALVEITIPATTAAVNASTRTVEYLCRIARLEPIGQLTGMGIEFVRKLR